MAMGRGTTLFLVSIAVVLTHAIRDRKEDTDARNARGGAREGSAFWRCSGPCQTKSNAQMGRRILLTHNVRKSDDC